MAKRKRLAAPHQKTPQDELTPGQREFEKADAIPPGLARDKAFAGWRAQSGNRPVTAGDIRKALEDRPDVGRALETLREDLGIAPVTAMMASATGVVATDEVVRGLYERHYVRAAEVRDWSDGALPKLPSREGLLGLADLRDWCVRAIGIHTGAAEPLDADDMIPMAVAIRDYSVSARTIRREVKAGTLHNYRPAGARRTATFVLSRAELAARWPRKK